MKEGFAENPEAESNLIPIDMTKDLTFEQVLSQLYGVQGEYVEFDPSDYPKYQVTLKNRSTETFTYKGVTKYQRFTHLPAVISFLIKRFKGNKSGNQKNKADFDMPLTLVLIEQPPEKEKRYKKYALKAVAVHHGEDLHQGHYYTHRRDGEVWTKANDQELESEDSPGKDLAKGYIYTYELVATQDELPKGCSAPQEATKLLPADDMDCTEDWSSLPQPTKTEKEERGVNPKQLGIVTWNVWHLSKVVFKKEVEKLRTELKQFPKKEWTLLFKNLKSLLDQTQKKIAELNSSNENVEHDIFRFSLRTSICSFIKVSTLRL